MTVVVDSSAILAVLLAEPDADDLGRALAHIADDVHVSVFTVVESSMVLESRKGAEAVADMQSLLARLEAQVQPVTVSQADLALRAWRRFGKGRHPASLNLGDCFSYALAASLGARLFYKGNDFRQTDIPSVLD